MPAAKSRNPKEGAKPSKSTPPQTSMPGRERSMRPKPDHGEESYRGCGRLRRLAAIITGGDSGIGRAVAIAFAREGADGDRAVVRLSGVERRPLLQRRRARADGIGDEPLISG